MISAWHILWIVPLSAGLGLLGGALASAGRSNDEYIHIKDGVNN